MLCVNQSDMTAHRLTQLHHVLNVPMFPLAFERTSFIIVTTPKSPIAKLLSPDEM